MYGHASNIVKLHQTCSQLSAVPLYIIIINSIPTTVKKYVFAAIAVPILIQKIINKCKNKLDDSIGMKEGKKRIVYFFIYYYY